MQGIYLHPFSRHNENRLKLILLSHPFFQVIGSIDDNNNDHYDSVLIILWPMTTLCQQQQQQASGRKTSTHLKLKGQQIRPCPSSQKADWLNFYFCVCFLIQISQLSLNSKQNLNKFRSKKVCVVSFVRFEPNLRNNDAAYFYVSATARLPYTDVTHSCAHSFCGPSRALARNCPISWSGHQNSRRFIQTGDQHNWIFHLHHIYFYRMKLVWSAFTLPKKARELDFDT